VLDQFGSKCVAFDIPNKPFGENVFKNFLIAILVEDNSTSISSIQGMVDRVLLVSTFRAVHLRTLTDFNLAVMSPDTFSSLELIKQWSKDMRIPSPGCLSN